MKGTEVQSPFGYQVTLLSSQRLLNPLWLLPTRDSGQLGCSDLAACEWEVIHEEISGSRP